ncbi:hypothetical protein GCM10027447_23380 [Glycomyces halotolerans]
MSDSAARPRRIVMLVQNGVVGDSRIQKEAESAARAGWDVVLLGRSTTSRPEEWTVGDARIRLLPAPRTFERRRHEVRRAWLRSPLAYPPGPLQEYRRKQVRAWKTDLRTARDRLAFDAPRGAEAIARRIGLAARRTAVTAAWAWIGVRSRLTDRLRERRSNATGWPEKIAGAFWKRVLGDRAWRRLDPALWDLELAFGPVIDELRPDLIHANDFQMLGVGARAKLRAAASGRDVKLVWDAHEFLPGMKPWKQHPWWLAAQEAHEREHAPCADAVVTVSEPLADLLVDEHGLAERPAVVMNAPDVSGEWDAAPSLREHCGIGPDTPLIVYSGAPLEQRGMHLIVEALPELPEIHAAFVVSKPHWRYVRRMEARAAELGVADRTHVLTYVAYRQIVPYLSEADVGVHPLRAGIVNHEIALANKFFEYSHAHLPIVVSDVKTMGEMVRRTGQGEVFKSGDVDDLARAIKQILDDPERYRKAYNGQVPLDEWTWEGQAGRLAEVYARLLGRHHEKDVSAQ